MKITSIVLSLALALAAAVPLLACSRPASAEAQQQSREVSIMVHGAFVPSEIAATEGERLRLKFVRHDTGGCTKEVVFPKLGIRKELPTGETVTIDLPELSAGEVNFECGMGMIKGTITVAPKR